MRRHDELNLMNYAFIKVKMSLDFKFCQLMKEKDVVQSFLGLVLLTAMCWRLKPSARRGRRVREEKVE